MSIISTENIARIHEHCGILTACLIDPLSQLISKIMGLREDEPNCVGFYYEAALHGVHKCTVILFNIYDNDPVPWLRLGYTMDLLLASPFVTRVTYYPLITNDTDASLLSRATMTPKNVNKRLEESFRAIVVEIISSNASSIHDKNISYTAMLLKIAGITGEDADHIINTLITGYSLVNKVLLALMGIKHSDLTKIATNIIPCPLLKKATSITSPRENINESDIKYVIEESRREITKLVAIFADLFTTHDTFRAHILALRSKQGKNSNLEGLFAKEDELMAHIVGGLQNGILSNATLNEIIKDLGNERFMLGNYAALPMSTEPVSTINITNDTMLCTFHQQTPVTNTDPLRDLGTYITHIADAFIEPDALIINLGAIIASYNAAVQGTSLAKITVPHLGGTNTISRQAVVTIAGDGETLAIPTQTRVIPMYNANLTNLAEDELYDILIYIDSLRDSDGTSDTRFASLQNDITQELARRRKIQQ